MDHLRVLLAEDHAVVREGTRRMLEQDGVLTVVGEAADGAAAVSLAAELAPDIVLMDLGLPILNGVEATRRIRSLPNPPRVLLLSAYDDEDYMVAAIEAGASGYILKTARTADVIAAIAAVGSGEMVLHPSLVQRLLGRRADAGTPSSILTDREFQVLRLAARGAHNKEIAGQLTVSVRTVEGHFTAIFNKLGVGTRSEAIIHAASHGWLKLERDRPLG